MKKPINLKLFLLLVLLGCSIIANAQKLPNKQETSLRALANIKIDGIATEWDNKFQARNNAIEASYTLSNDDEILYLTIQTKTA